MVERTRVVIEVEEANPHDPQLCGLDEASSCPGCRQLFCAATYSAPRRLWARLVGIVGHLRRALRTDVPELPARDHAVETAILRALCEPEFREAVLTALAPGVKAIARVDREGGGQQ